MRTLVSLLFATVMVPGAAAETYTFTGEAVEIPTSGPADPSFIYVEGVKGEVLDIKLTLTNLDHRYGAEAMLVISNPDGWSTLLFDGPRCRFTGVDIVFADDAEEDVGEGCSSTIASGTYRPGHANNDHEFTIPIAPLPPYEATLGALAMPDLNGRWILWAEDFVSGDGGTIDNWVLEITTAPID